MDDAPADHDPTVANGGTDEDLVPVCAVHQDRHGLGIDTWCARYRIDREKAKAAARAAWERHVASSQPQ